MLFYGKRCYIRELNQTYNKYIQEYFISFIETFQLNIPPIVFNSEDWGGKNYDGEVPEEIITFLQKSRYSKILIQNMAYDFGDTEVHPIVMISSDDYDGFKWTLTTFIKDVVYNLLPEDYYDYPLTFD